MEINFSKKEILNVIKDIANEDYQRRAWFNIGPEVSSPDEDICILYDDYSFEEFLQNLSSPINNKEREAGKLFCDIFNNYLNTSDTSDPYLVYHSEQCKEIRKEARKLIDIWTFTPEHLSIVL